MKFRCSFNLIFEKIWVFFLVLGVYGYCLLSIYGLPHGFYEYSFEPVNLFKCYDDLGSTYPGGYTPPCQQRHVPAAKRSG